MKEVNRDRTLQHEDGDIVMQRVGMAQKIHNKHKTELGNDCVEEENVKTMSGQGHDIVALRRYRNGLRVFLLVGSLLHRLSHFLLLFLQLLHLLLQFFLDRRSALTSRIESHAFVVTRTHGPSLRRGNRNYASAGRQPTVEGRGENPSRWMLECACRTST